MPDSTGEMADAGFEDALFPTPYGRFANRPFRSERSDATFRPPVPPRIESSTKLKFHMIPSSRHLETVKERSIRLAEEFLAGWNAHDVERVAALHAPEFEGVDVGRSAVYLGPRGASDLMSESLEAFPDLALSREEVIAEGNLIAVVWTARGTHEGGNLMRIPPTGLGICVRGVSLLTVSESGITHALYVWDTAGLLRNIGLLPEL